MAEQHSHFSPADAERQRALTAEAEQSAAGYSMWLCADCGLEWADPMQAPNSNWYALAYATLDLYPGERWEFDRVLASVRQGDSVLDIGCGSGAFLKRCAEGKQESRGVDFAAEPVRLCKEQGLDAELIDLVGEAQPRAGRAANVLTAFQVLEHLTEPRRLFEFADLSSTPEAVLWVAVPSNKRPSRVFSERDFLDQPPHHLTRWTESSLANLGRQCGWTLETMSFEPLSVSAALWWISTRTAFYQRVTARGRRAFKTVEQLARVVQYPAAVVLANTRYRTMSGFSMLGCFRKGLR